MNFTFLENRPNRSLGAFESKAEEAEFIRKLFLGADTINWEYVSGLSKLDPDKIPFRDVRGLLSLLEVFDRNTDHEFLYIFFRFLGMKGPDFFIPLERYQILTTILNSREKIQQLLSFLTDRMNMRICMSCHGIFTPYLHGKEFEIFSLVERASKTLCQFGYRLIPFYGTLLGLTRNGSILEHDDDLDFLLISDDGDERSWDEMLMDIKPIFECNGYSIACELHGHAHVKFEDDFHHFDIFFGSKSAGQVRIKSYISEPGYFSFCSNALVNLEYRDFGSFSVCLPQERDAILCTIYGENWMVEDKFFGWPWKLKN